MSDLAAQKAALRKAALARRDGAVSAARQSRAATRLADALLPHAGKAIAGYLPIRSEADPRPAMEVMATYAPVCVPVMQGAGRPLIFQRWTPGCALIDGPFGTKAPAEGEALVPEVLIVPLVGFDAQLSRLGYGGGFYDRTLEGLRAAGPAYAIGFAFEAQLCETLPLEASDQPLDEIITEAASRP